MYDTVISSDTARVIVDKGWNLGDIFITTGVTDAIDGLRSPVEDYLRRHFYGDHGLASEDPVDARRTHTGRAEGRPFASLFADGDVMLKLVTNPMLARTVICLSRED